MHQYGLTFGFRTPYQCLVDTQMIQDAARFNMDLAGGLSRTLHGEVKPSVYGPRSTMGHPLTIVK